MAKMEEKSQKIFKIEDIFSIILGKVLIIFLDKICHLVFENLDN